MATRSDRPDPDPNPAIGSATPNTGSTTTTTTTTSANTGGTGATVTGASVPPPQIDARPSRRTRSNLGHVRPIVLKVRKRGRRRGGRKRYSRNSKDFQRLAYGASRAIYRLADGAAAGTDSFWRRSDRSARRKKDGLAIDFARNSARAFDRAARQFGRAPYEVAREISGRRAWKNVRRLLRSTPFRLGYIR
jgi:hypothetical protein